MREWILTETRKTWCTVTTRNRNWVAFVRWFRACVSFDLYMIHDIHGIPWVIRPNHRMLSHSNGMHVDWDCSSGNFSGSKMNLESIWIHSFLVETEFIPTRTFGACSWLSNCTLPYLYILAMDVIAHRHQLAQTTLHLDSLDFEQWSRDLCARSRTLCLEMLESVLNLKEIVFWSLGSCDKAMTAGASQGARLGLAVSCLFQWEVTIFDIASMLLLNSCFTGRHSLRLLFFQAPFCTGNNGHRMSSVDTWRCSRFAASGGVSMASWICWTRRKHLTGGGGKLVCNLAMWLMQLVIKCNECMHKQRPVWWLTYSYIYRLWISIWLSSICNVCLSMSVVFHRSMFSPTC